MQKWRALVSSIACLAVLATFLIGCDSAGVTSQVTESTSPAESSGTVSSETVSSEAENNVSEITYWSGYTQESRIGAMNAIAERFEAETGIKVEQEVVPWGSQAEKWRAAYAAGGLPAAMTTLMDQVMHMSLVGATVPMNDVVDKIGGPDAFTSGALSVNLYSGNYIGMPHYAHCRLLFYRDDTLQALNLEMPDYPSPEEITQIATTMTDSANNQYGFVQYFAQGDETPPYWLDIYMKYYGADWFDENNTVIFDSPETVQAVNAVLNLYKSASVPGALDYTNNDQFTLFTTGTTQMVYQTGFLLSNILTDNPDMLENVGVTAAPGWMVDVVDFVVFDTDVQDVGKRYIEFMYREDNYFELINTITPGQTPVILKYLEEGSEYWKHPNFTGGHSELMMKAARLTAEGVDKGSFPGATNGIAIATASIRSSGLIQDMFADIITNNKDVATAVADTAVALQAYVDDLVAASAA